MSAIGNVVIAIKAVDEASSVMDALTVGLSGLSTTVGQISPQLGSLMQGFAAGGPIGLAVAGIGQLVGGLQDCVKAAIDSEQVWSRLKETVSRTGYTWEEVGGKIESAITGLMNVSRYSDEKLASAMKTLMQYGMGVDEAMTALADTMDLATAKQVDLESAATAVGKAFQGNTGVLERMGVVVNDSKDSAVKFASAMGSIRESFGGAAQADIESYAGKWAQFTNKWNELMEKIGTGLLPVLTKIVDGLIVIVDGVSGFVDSIQKILGGFYDWLVGGSFVQDMLALVLDLFTGGLASLLKLIVGNLDGIMSTFADWGKMVLDVFNNIWNDIVNSAIGAFNRICDAVKNGINAVTGFFNNLWTSLTKGSIWTDMWAEMVELTTSGMRKIDVSVASGMGQLEARMTHAAASTRILTTALANMVPKPSAEAVDNVKWALDAMNDQIKTSGVSLQDLQIVYGDTISTATTVGEALDQLRLGFDEGKITIEELVTGFKALGLTLEDEADVLMNYGNSWTAMASQAENAYTGIVAGFRRAAEEIKRIAQDVHNSLVGGSIWTDMWKKMVGQTEAGLSEILSETERSVGSFEKMFAGTAGGLSVSGAALSPGAATAAASTGPTHMTVPITITVQHMTGEVKDLENLTRMICRELGNTVKWRT